jgi:iron complex transport system substrate-binding protein
MSVRICSLLPSATELVAELGLAHALVAVSEECDWPPEVRELPVVTSSRVDPNALSSFEIDGAVRDALQRGESLYSIDQSLIESLDPDLIITQDLCSVCAVSSAELGRLCSVRAEVVSLDPHTIADVERSVLELAAHLRVPDRGRAVVDAMECKLATVWEAVNGRRRPDVFVCEWLEPPFAAGHWVPEMVDAAGGREVLGREGRPSFTTTWEEVSRCKPELVVLAPCGWNAERAAREARLPDLRARVVAVDANAFYSRPAPRIADGVRQLAYLLHPDAVGDPGLPWIDLTPVQTVTRSR